MLPHRHETQNHFAEGSLSRKENLKLYEFHSTDFCLFGGVIILKRTLLEAYDNMMTLDTFFL